MPEPGDTGRMPSGGLAEETVPPIPKDGPPRITLPRGPRQTARAGRGGAALRWGM